MFLEYGVEACRQELDAMIRPSGTEHPPDPHRHQRQFRARPDRANKRFTVVHPMTIDARHDKQVWPMLTTDVENNLVRDTRPEVANIMTQLLKNELDEYQIPRVRIRRQPRDHYAEAPGWRRNPRRQHGRLVHDRTARASVERISSTSISAESAMYI